MPVEEVSIFRFSTASRVKSLTCFFDALLRLAALKCKCSEEICADAKMVLISQNCAESSLDDDTYTHHNLRIVHHRADGGKKYKIVTSRRDTRINSDSWPVAFGGEANGSAPWTAT